MGPRTASLANGRIRLLVGSARANSTLGYPERQLYGERSQPYREGKPERHLHHSQHPVSIRPLPREVRLYHAGWNGAPGAERVVPDDPPE